MANVLFWIAAACVLVAILLALLKKLVIWMFSVLVMWAMGHL